MQLAAHRRSLVLVIGGAVACGAPPPPAVVPLQSERVGAVESFGPGLVATDDSGATIQFANIAPASVVIVRVWPSARLEALYPARDRDSTRFPVGLHTVAVAPPRPWMAWPLLGPAEPREGASSAEEELTMRCFWNELRRQVPPPPPQVRGDTARRTLAERLGDVDLSAIEDQCRAAARNRFAMPPGDTMPPAAKGYFLVLVAGEVPQSARHLRLKVAGMDITGSSVVSVLQALPALLAGSGSRRWAAYVAWVP